MGIPQGKLNFKNRQCLRTKDHHRDQTQENAGVLTGSQTSWLAYTRNIPKKKKSYIERSLFVFVFFLLFCFFSWLFIYFDISHHCMLFN